MVGQVDRKDEVSTALKVYISKDREKQRLEDEAEAEKTRKKIEQDEKKLKEETEYKATKDKLAELIKRNEQLQTEKVKVFEHLKKLLAESNKHRLEVDDLTKLYDIGLAVTHISPAASHPPIHPTNNVPATIIPRSQPVAVNNQYKTPAAAVLPVQTVPPQKRNRSPSPTVYRSAYGFKQAAGPHAFQKLEDPHRSHEYNRSYLYTKPNNPVQASSYGAFYPPAQNVAYTPPAQSVHSNTAVYNTYSSNRDNVDVMHKSQSPTGPPPPSAPQHSSLYAPHRSAMPSGPSPSIQATNHVYHSKSSQGYPDEKYYMVRPVHGVIPIQQPQSNKFQSNKHGSITSGYPVRPMVTQINPQAQLHIQSPHGGHHSSQGPHHPSQPPHHSSQGPHHSSQPSHHSSQGPHHSSQGPHHSSQPSHHASQPSHHSSQPSHHASLSSHHASQSHHPSQSSQSLMQQSHQSHHQQSSLHYPPHHSQSHGSSQSSQQSHAQQPPPVSVQSHHANHPSQHHQQHHQQLHVQSHHPSSSHHQLISHHGSPSIHHSQSQQHMQQAIHHQAMQSQAHHQSHSQQMHHQQMQQPHIQQHISHPSQSHQPGQQSQPTSVVTSQAYANQISAIQGGSRVVYSQHNLPH